MKAKYERSKSEGAQAFVNPEGYQRFIAAGKAAYLKELARQQGR